jgi:hypothetical protein
LKVLSLLTVEFNAVGGDSILFPIGEWVKERVDELMAGSFEQKYFNWRAVENVWKEFNLGRAHWSRPSATVVAGQAIGP